METHSLNRRLALRARSQHRKKRRARRLRARVVIAARVVCSMMTAKTTGERVKTLEDTRLEYFQFTNWNHVRIANWKSARQWTLCDYLPCSHCSHSTFFAFEKETLSFSGVAHRDIALRSSHARRMY